MFERYAIYHVPAGPLGQVGAAWLGWDMAAGAAVAHPNVNGVDVAVLTAAPRKYGLHATIKPPFFLARGTRVEALRDSVAALAERLGSVEVDGLQVTRLGRFLALTPMGEQDGLRALGANVVRELDPFRAPPAPAEIARRRPDKLSAVQQENLNDWGYPHVMEQFRFHITLTGRASDIDAIAPLVTEHFAPVLPAPYLLNTLSLAGQTGDGMFHEIERFDLGC